MVYDVVLTLGVQSLTKATIWKQLKQIWPNSNGFHDKN